MNPQPQESPASLSLPAPEAGPQHSASPVEQTRSFTEMAGARASEQAVPATASAHASVQATAQPTSAQPAAATGTPLVPLPQIADDVDLIEKEWVIKAKHIVAQTAHDPYLQNKEMSKVKADYLKKRYNKDLKLSED